MKHFIFISMLLIISALLTSCNQESYSSGYNEGYSSGSKTGYQQGFEAARPPTDSTLKGIPRVLVSVGSLFGYLKILLSTLVCGFLITFKNHSDSEWAAMAAKGIGFLFGGAVAFILYGFLSMEESFANVILTPAFSNRPALLLIIALCAAIGYLMISGVKFIVEEIDGLIPEVVSLILLGALSAMTVEIGVISSRAPDRLSYLGVYIFLGIFIGGLFYTMRWLIEVAQRQMEKSKTSNLS